MFFYLVKIYKNFFENFNKPTYQLFLYLCNFLVVMHKILLSFTFLFAALQMQAQTDEIPEQLRQIEQQLAEGTLSEAEMYQKYEEAMLAYSTRDMEKTRFYFKNALAFVRKKSGNQGSESRYYARMGSIFGGRNERDSADIYFDKAFKMIEGKEYFRSESANYELLGIYYSRYSDFENAMNAYIKALEANEKDKDKNIAEKQDINANIQIKATLLVNIAVLYGRMDNYDKYIDINLQAKKIIEENRQINLLILENIIVGNLSEVYLKIGQYDKAFPFVNKYYEFSAANGNLAGMVKGLRRLSMYYLHFGDLKKALSYAKETLQVAEKINRPYEINLAEGILTRVYIHLKDYKTALFYNKRVEARATEDEITTLETLYGNMVLIYALMGDIETSEEYLDKYVGLGQKKSDENLHKALREMEVKYDVQQKELEIVRQQAEIKHHKILQNIFIVGLIIALIIIVLATYLIRLRNKRNRELAEMNATKDKFFSIISHDLKNPAIAQRNALQMLAKNGGNFDAETLSKYHAELLKSADYNVELLNNLLNWAQVQTGRMPYNPTTFDIAAALHTEISILQNMAKAKEISLAVEMPAEAIITGDINMLTAVVRNLLTNAVKFTDQGGAVMLKISKKDAKYVISVSDTGAGMSAEQIQNLFRIDKQKPQKGTAGEQGSGLGLIVCKELVEKHNSTIYVESSAGKGSRFWFEII